MKLKSRKDMDKKYTWDLTAIYADDKAWEQDYEKAREQSRKLTALSGRLNKSREDFKMVLDAITKTSEIVSKVGLYTFLKKSGDNSDTGFQELNSKATSLATEFSANISFLEPEILELSNEAIDSYMNDKYFAEYKQFIDDIVRGKAHILDTDKEKLLAMMGEIYSIPSNNYSMLSEVDMTFPDIVGENGESLPLTHGNLSVYRESSCQAVRKNSFEVYFTEYEKYNNTFATIYSGAVKIDNVSAAIRGFETARHQALFASNVPIKVYDSLIEAIHSGLPTMERYTQLRKRALKLDEINMYDLYCPMLGEIDISMPFEKGKLLVLEACKPLGDGYVKLLEEACANSWMDVYENKGKTTGAYSCGVYGVHPYVLLNYTDTLDDAFTLAHELGHAMHSYLSAKKQPYISHDYKITVAEVASTVNEVLLTMHLLKVEKDKLKRAAILNHFLEGFRTTVFRQTLFAEFEKNTHIMAQNDIALTAKALNDEYKRLNEKYYKGVIINPLQAYEWSRIPHFYRSFYVYQYATGFCSAVAIAKTIIDTNDPSSYLEFLATGGSDYPINELKIAGIDLENPDTIKKALQVFDETVTELTQLMEDLNLI